MNSSQGAEDPQRPTVENPSEWSSSEKVEGSSRSELPSTFSEEVEYIELFWDCPNCGHTHISAILNPQGDRCPECFHWRSKEVTLYEAADSQVITDPDLINRKPAWVCKICGAVNDDEGLAPHLLQCGNCDNYQTAAMGELTGDVEADRQGPETLPVGEPVASHSHTAAPTTPAPAAPTPQPQPLSRNLDRNDGDRLCGCWAWCSAV